MSPTSRDRPDDHLSPTSDARPLRAAAIFVASSRATASTEISSSTFPGSMIASQVNGGEIDIHTLPRTTATTTVVLTFSMPLTETLRGIPACLVITTSSITPIQIRWNTLTVTSRRADT